MLLVAASSLVRATLCATLLLPALVHSLALVAPRIGATKAPAWSGHNPESLAPGGWFGGAKRKAALTYLEINGWLLTAAGVTILIDPVLEGPLDFGIPDLYTGTKRTLPSEGLAETLPPLDALVITQGLDDHCHARTLAKLSELDPRLPVIAPPSARAALEPLPFEDVTYVTSNYRRIAAPYFGLESLPPVRLPNGSDLDEAVVRPRRTGDSGEGGLSIKATSGALVGPPWQRRENGYVLRPLEENAGPSFYIEPHVEYDPVELSSLKPVDIAITPTSGYGLPIFDLVHGPEDAAELIERLRPKFVVPMNNGAIDAEGAASKLVKDIGSFDEFRDELKRRRDSEGLEIVEVRPGEPIELVV